MIVALLGFLFAAFVVVVAAYIATIVIGMIFSGKDEWMKVTGTKKVINVNDAIYFYADGTYEDEMAPGQHSGKTVRFVIAKSTWNLLDAIVLPKSNNPAYGVQARTITRDALHYGQIFEEGWLIVDTQTKEWTIAGRHEIYGMFGAVYYGVGDGSEV